MIMKINELELDVIDLLSQYGIDKQSVRINGEWYNFDYGSLKVHFAVQEGKLLGEVYIKSTGALDDKLDFSFALKGPLQNTIDRMFEHVINTEERISSLGSSYTNPSRCSSK